MTRRLHIAIAIVGALWLLGQLAPTDQPAPQAVTIATYQVRGACPAVFPETTKPAAPATTTSTAGAVECVSYSTPSSLRYRAHRPLTAFTMRRSPGSYSSGSTP